MKESAEKGISAQGLEFIIYLILGISSFGLVNYIILESLLEFDFENIGITFSIFKFLYFCLPVLLCFLWFFYPKNRAVLSLKILAGESTKWKRVILFLGSGTGAFYLIAFYLLFFEYSESSNVLLLWSAVLIGCSVLVGFFLVLRLSTTKLVKKRLNYKKSTYSFILNYSCWEFITVFWFVLILVVFALLKMHNECVAVDQSGLKFLKVRLELQKEIERNKGTISWLKTAARATKSSSDSITKNSDYQILQDLMYNYQLSKNTDDISFQKISNYFKDLMAQKDALKSDSLSRVTWLTELDSRNKRELNLLKAYEDNFGEAWRKLMMKTNFSGLIILAFTLLLFMCIWYYIHLQKLLPKGQFIASNHRQQLAKEHSIFLNKTTIFYPLTLQKEVRALLYFISIIILPTLMPAEFLSFDINHPFTPNPFSDSEPSKISNTNLHFESTNIILEEQNNLLDSIKFMLYGRDTIVVKSFVQVSSDSDSLTHIISKLKENQVTINKNINSLGNSVVLESRRTLDSASIKKLIDLYYVKPIHNPLPE